MSTKSHYDHLETSDHDRFASIISWAFGGRRSGVLEWLEKTGPEKVRVLRRGGELQACLTLLEMGQWFGGESVSMTGIGGVAVAPEARGQGLALELMHSALSEIREKGFALSTLFPATESLYRKLGYELAGCRFRHTLRTKALNLRERGRPLTPIEPRHQAAVRKLHREFARHNPGNLDRGEYAWRRVVSPRQAEARGFLVGPEDGPEDGPEGYVYVVQKPAERPGFHDLTLTDLVATSPGAARRLLGFLAEHRSMSLELSWSGGASDPVLAVLPERVDKVILGERWMVRVVDVERALRERGYPHGLEARLELEVRDPAFPDNDGRFTLLVSGGRGQVRRGGSGELGLGIGGLASLYTGFQSPWALRLAGLLEGPQRALGTAATVFAGLAPWMPDMF